MVKSNFNYPKVFKDGLPGRRLNVKMFNKRCSSVQRMKEQELACLLIGINVEYRNSLGYKYNSDGSPVRKNNAEYYLYKMDSLNTSDGENELQLYGWFCKSTKYRGFCWGSMEDFEKNIVENNRYSVGRLKFDSYKDGYLFLNEIEKTRLAEKVANESGNKDSNWISCERYLKEFIKGLFLGDETDKSHSVEFSNDGMSVKIHTGLMTKKQESIIISGEYIRKGDDIEIRNPQITKGKTIRRKPKRYNVSEMKIKINKIK